MLWLAKFFTKGKTVKDAIKYFHTINGRMPNNLETIKIKNAFMEQTRGSNVIDITSRLKDDWWKTRPGFKRQHPEVAKKTDESPLSALLKRQGKELEGIDQGQGMGFYREMGDMMKKHELEELELKYDEMFNKILEKAKRIESDPLPLLEAELGKKLTGKETTTQLLDLFKNRPKKASGGIARVGMVAGGPIQKGAAWVIKNLKKSRKEVIEGKGTFSKLNSMQQEQLKWELSALIKQLEQGGKIPDDMIQTMRQDKRFKDLVKTPSTDPELRELEEVLLDTSSGKNLEQKQILEEFDVTGKKGHAEGGIAGELHLNRPGYKVGKIVEGIEWLTKLLKGGKKQDLTGVTGLYKHIDMKKLMAGKDPITVYSGSMKRPSNTWQSFKETAKDLGTTPETIAKDNFKDQWFTPFKSYADSFSSPKYLESKLRTVDLTPKEIAIAKRYVEKINKKHYLASMRKKLKIDKGPKHRVTTDDNLVLIPRYKLKELEKSGRMKTDYMILETLKKKMGVAEGGLAHVLGV